MLNHIDIMGRLTRDPELRYTQSNLPVTSFTIACERDYGKDKEKEVDFIDVVAWRHTAEFVTNYFSKGRMAIVSGRLQTRTYEDKDGHKRKAVEIVADNVYFGDSKKDPASNQSQFNSQPQYNTPQQSQQTQQTEFYQLTEDDEDLPF